MSSDEISWARAEATRQQRNVDAQTPVIRAKAQALRWRLAENNLAARIRAALSGEGS